jgi:hypothetical protein
MPLALSNRISHEATKYRNEFAHSTVYFGVASDGATAEVFGPRLRRSYFDPNFDPEGGHDASAICAATSRFARLEDELRKFGDEFPAPPPSLLSGLV